MEKRPEENSVEERSTGFINNRTLIIVLSVAVAILVAVLAFFLISKAKLVKELNAEKAELTEQYEALQSDYDNLSCTNAEINAQLDSSRQEVQLLLESIKKTEATNRRKIRQYEKELGTLRSIMRNYIVQIDSLNTLNHKLTADAAAARKETAAVRKVNEVLQAQVSTLADKVETGAIVRAQGITAEAVNRNGKVVERANAVESVIVSLTLIENSLAEQGPLRVYVVVTDPEGKLLTNAQSTGCNYAGGTLATSASREIDYQGAQVDMSIYLTGIGEYFKGIYTVQVLTEKALLGSTQFILR